MMKIGKCLALLLLVSVGACAMPTTTTTSSTPRPTLGIKNAPASSLVRLDGVILGNSGDMNGATDLVRIEEGLHTLEVLSDGRVIHKEQIYVSGGETKIVDVGVGEKR